MKPGTLYLVPTPIGNLEDITLRALRVLREVDLIACEDTRRTAGLLTHFGISTPRESFHEHNEAVRARKLIERLEEGDDIALVSDAGMPLVSDPGFLMVRECLKSGIRVETLPGASAVLLALAGSGLPTDAFCFAGFLPARRSQRRRKLEEWSSQATTMIFFEAPHRLVSSVEDMADILGPRPACIARELTKVHEEWLRGTLPELLEEVKSRERIRGEITIVTGPGEPIGTRPDALPSTILEHLSLVMTSSGLSQKEALRVVARERSITRREAYAQLLREREAQPGKRD